MPSTAPQSRPSQPSIRPRSVAPPPDLRPALDGLGVLAANPSATYDGTNADAFLECSRVYIAKVIELFVEIQRLDEVPNESGFDDSFGDIFADIFEDAAPVPAASKPRPGDICFGGALELNAVLRQLDEARSVDEALVACEAGQRKARRAIRAVLDAAEARATSAIEATPERESGVVEAPDADVENAISVRRLYARFRRSLRRPASESAEDVLVCVRYAAGALATLLTATDSSTLRVSDRVMLRSLRDRVFEWARGDRGVQAGLQVLGDVFTSADLLRGINQRQELRAHDRSVIATLLAFGDQADGSDMVLRLEGLDDELDRILERRSQDGISAVREALLARLTELA